MDNTSMKHSYIIFALLVSGCVDSMPSYRVVHSDFVPHPEYDKAEFFAVYIDIPDSLKTDSSSYLRVSQDLVKKNNCNNKDVCMFLFYDEWVLTSGARFNIPFSRAEINNMIALYSDRNFEDQPEGLVICGMGRC